MAHKRPKTRRKPHANPRGIFEGNPRGFGFVKTAEGEYFIPASKANGAFDGDVVEIAKATSKRDSRGKKPSTHRKGSSSERNRAEARVVSVIERAHDVIVGRYEVAGPFGIVVPDDARITHDIFTIRRDSPDVPDGAFVRVKITEFPTRKTSATGVVIEVLDDSGQGALVEERIIAKHNLETKFSSAALAEAESAVLDVEGALVDGYRDIRDRFIFTIDPADAKDFDDALSLDRIEVDAGAIKNLEDLSKEFGVFKGSIDDEAFQKALANNRGLSRLGVHIADVSRYVEWGSSVDLEARRRATSVYLADRVLPMLPEALSNNLCSLRPDEDRLCFTVDLYLTEEADLAGYDIYPAVMRSNARLTYEEALRIIEDPEDSADDLKSRIRSASELSKARAAARERMGGIEFSTKEAKVIFDDEGEVSGIAVRQKNDATSLIEEAMIYANEVVATHLSQNDWPCAYRDHEPPSADSLSALVQVLQEYSWFTKKDADGILRGSQHAIQMVLDKCKGRIEEDMITMLFLRSMMRAVYSQKNLGHYGLGLKAYCHFTSPIRRYPDLIVHRMLKAQLIKRPELFDQEVSSLRWLCEHSSEMERVAETASMDSQKAHIVEYMSQFIGHEFDAIVSGVATYGLYVRLDNCAEGLVPIRTLGSEYFYLDDVRHTLKGSDTGTTYRLGQFIRVKLVEADLQKWHLDFNIVTDGR